MDKRKIVEYFEGLLAKHGDNYLALDWNSPESQEVRFHVFQEIFVYGRKAANISVLDIGCGFGDLYGFFKANGVLNRQKIRYTGYDISDKLLAAGRKKYPEATLEHKDILEEIDIPRFDYVFCSGVFNIRTADIKTHLDFVKIMLLRMYELSNCGVAVNFLSEGALPIANPEDLKTGRYFFFDPEQILNFCRMICSCYILRHDYHLGDFTVYLLK